VQENLGEYTHELSTNVINMMKGEFKKWRLPIRGDFDIDDEGIHLMVKGIDGKLIDWIGSKASKSGSLIYIKSNIMMKKNILIFRKN
jgi:hypothetical protein